MNKFLPTNKRDRTCPICSDTSGKCREVQDATLYFCMSEADQDAQRQGFRYLGSTKDRLWGKYIPDTGADGRSWQDVIEQRNRRREQERKQRRERLSQSLSVDERSAEFRKLLLQSPLTEAHQQNLRDRGLSDNQIQSSLIHSVTPGQQVEDISSRLPGIGGDGQLRVAGSGFLCPAFDIHGHIVGCQVRLDDATDNKYRWLKGHFSSHLPSGELPLTVARGGGQGIGLIEGILKPQVSALRFGGSFIGAAGGSFTASSQQLRGALTQLSQEQETNLVTLYPDAGGVSNRHVYRRDCETIRLVQSWGYRVQVANWGQFGNKSQPDFDELPPTEQVRLISSNEYLALKPQELAQRNLRHEPNQQAYNEYRAKEEKQELDLERDCEREQQQWREQTPIRAKNRWRKSKQFSPTHTINSNYFQCSLGEPGEIIAVRSGLGSGKTQWVGDKVTELPSEGWLALGHRNSLLIQSAESRWGFYHLRSLEAQGESGRQQVNGLIRDTTSKLACCIDSITKFRPQDFNNRNLVIDETMAVILHALMGKTDIRRYRRRALQFLQEALKRAGRIFLLDGMLADAVVDYIAKLAGSRKVVKVQNLHSPPSWDVTFLTGTVEEGEGELKRHSNDRSPLVDALRDAPNPIIAVDSQVTAAAFEKILNEQGREGIRIDSTTVTDETVRDFLRYPDQWIKANQPDYVIYSPSAQDGIDISIQDYFTHQFCFFFGVLTTDAQVQMIGRVRDSKVKRLVWCREFGHNDTEDTRSPFTGTVKRANEEFLVQDALDAIEGHSDASEVLPILQELAASRKDDPHEEMWSQLKATFNYEKSNLRECLLEKLVENRHKVETTDLSQIEAAKQLEKRVKDEVRDEYSADIYNAEEISSSEIDEYSFSGDYDKQCAVKKAIVKQRLPGIEKHSIWTQDFIRLVQFDNRNFTRQQERFWLLQHPEVARQEQQEKWNRLIRGFQHKFDLKSDRARVKALLELDIMHLINSDAEWSKDSPELVELLERSRDKKIYTALGIHPGKSDPTRWLRRLLDLIGIKLKSRQVRSDGVPTRYYRIDREAMVQPERVAALACLDTRWRDYVTGVRPAPRFDEVKQHSEKTSHPQQQQVKKWLKLPRCQAGKLSQASMINLNRTATPVTVEL
jgi:hypothetical protein